MFKADRSQRSGKKSNAEESELGYSPGIKGSMARIDEEDDEFIQGYKGSAKVQMEN